MKVRVREKKLTRDNMRWITRERPKIDRVACPWLISRFIDPEAEFISFRQPRLSKKLKSLMQYLTMFTASSSLTTESFAVSTRF
jgi:hypothetical protein